MQFSNPFARFVSLSDNALPLDLIMGILGWLIVLGLAIYFFQIKDYTNS